MFKVPDCKEEAFGPNGYGILSFQVNRQTPGTFAYRLMDENGVTVEEVSGGDDFNGTYNELVETKGLILTGSDKYYIVLMEDGTSCPYNFEVLPLPLNYTPYIAQKEFYECSVGEGDVDLDIDIEVLGDPNPCNTFGLYLEQNTRFTEKLLQIPTNCYKPFLPMVPKR